MARPTRLKTGATTITRFSETTAIALVISASMMATAHAGQLNTTPLNAQGQPVSHTAVTTAGGLLSNTTISSSMNVPHTVVTTAGGLQANTTISSSINAPHTVVTTAGGLQSNTTIGSSLNVPHVVLTTTAGLQINTTTQPHIVFPTLTVPHGATSAGASSFGDGAAAAGGDGTTAGSAGTVSITSVAAASRSPDYVAKGDSTAAKSSENTDPPFQSYTQSNQGQGTNLCTLYNEFQNNQTNENTTSLISGGNWIN